MTSKQPAKRQRELSDSFFPHRQKRTKTEESTTSSDDIEVWLIKKPNGLPEKTLRHMSIPEEECWTHQSTSGAFECQKRRLGRPVIVLQPDELNREEFQPVTAPVRGVIQISHSIHTFEPIAPVSTAYEFPKLKHLRQRFKPFGTPEEIPEHKKKKKHRKK